MISIDAYIIDFVSGNWIFLSLAVGMLKIVAKMTPWDHDDSLVTLLAGVMGMIPKGRMLEVGGQEGPGVGEDVKGG